MACKIACVAALAGAVSALPPVGVGQPSRTASATDSDVSVEYSSDGLSIVANQVELETLLIEIGEQLGIAIQMPATAGERLSLAIENTPVAEGIERLLRNHSYVLSYSEPWTGSINESPNRLWILANDAETASRPLNANRRPSTVDEPRISERTAIASVEHAVALAGGNDARLLDHLSTVVLGTADAEERAQAVYALAELGSPAGSAVLEQALDDPSPAVREAAVVNLGLIGDAWARIMLERALADEDANVRQAALDMLEPELADDIW